jgi:iron complex transport system permease protein
VCGTVGLLLGAASLATLMLGATHLPAGTVLAILGGHESPGWANAIVWQIRVPRLFFGWAVGCALATSGALMQGIFRNPLADPTLVGVAGGAALGASTAIVMGGVEVGGLSAVSAAALVGGLLATLIVYRLSVVRGRTVAFTMLLAGIAINALASAGTGLWTYVAEDQQIRDIAFWSLGSLAGASWDALPILLPMTLVPFFLSLRWCPALDALLLGEAEAHHIGVDVRGVRRRAVAATAIMVASAVAVSGLIFFVGIMIPHVVRLLVGPGHRWLLPLSGLLGAGFLLAADLVARVAVAPAELPIGIVTALVGAPFFLVLLRRAA